MNSTLQALHESFPPLFHKYELMQCRGSIHTGTTTRTPAVLVLLVLLGGL